MKHAKSVFLSIAAALVLVVVWGCQNASSTPTAPQTPLLQSTLAESNAGGRHLGTGGIKVDSYCGGSNLCSSDNEDNTIPPASGAIVWIQSGSGAFCARYDYRIVNNGNVVVGSGTLAAAGTCGDKLARYTFTTPIYEYGSVTLTAICYDTGSEIGSDSFRLTFDAKDCFK